MDDVMSVTFSLNQLAWGTLFIIACAIGVYLIMALIKLNKILRRVDGFIETNEPHFSAVSEELPEVVTTVKETVDTVNQSINNAGSALGLIAKKDNDNFPCQLETISYVVQMAKDLFQFIMGFFSKK